jgi:hypothetical protein
MTPSTTDFTILSLLSGGIGGIIAAVDAIYGGFKRMPSPRLSKSKVAVSDRSMFIAFRGAVGAVCAWGATVGWSSDFSLEQLISIQFMVGLLGPALLRRLNGSVGRLSEHH